MCPVLFSLTNFIISESVHTSLPTPRRKTPRKRALTPNNDLLPIKRKLDQFTVETCSSQYNRSPYQNQTNLSTSPTKGGYSSQLEGSHSSQPLEKSSSQFENENKVFVTNIPWIKPEPVEEYTSIIPNGTSPDSSISHDANVSPVEDSSKNSIVNRPTSLIPLANIFKKYGMKSTKNDRIITPEPVVEPHDKENLENMSDNLPSEKSILRSLYETPLYGMEDYSSGTNDLDSCSQVAINLPQDLSESLEQFPSTTENLVLSGYYDSENYPSYRHNKRHPVQISAKKSKNKEKASNGNVATGSASYVDSLASPGNSEMKMKMFESGGRLVYACDVCKRELSHLTSYRRHMKLHTMDRPHKCPVCSKGFIRKYHCIDHLNKHHKGVEFDHDTLTIRGSMKGLDDATGYSDSLSISPGEYNYTLDQTIEEADQSLNTSIDQSASSMLTELAKSAQKAQIRDQAGTEISNKSVSDMKINKQSEEADTNMSQSEEVNFKCSESENSRKENENPDELNATDDIESEFQPISSFQGKQESSSLARKYEVTEGIKAIVAHLKSSSKKKKMITDSEVELEKSTNEEA